MRIRRNWSSSRGAEELEPTPALAIETEDMDMDTAGNPLSPYRPNFVDEEDARLAAESLKSFEFDDERQTIKQETVSARSWDRAVIVGLGDGLSKHEKFEMCSRQILGELGPDTGTELVSDVKNSTGRKDTAAEDKTKSGSLNSKTESDLSGGTERLSNGFKRGPEHKVARGLAQMSMIEREEVSEHPVIVEGGISGRKKRRKISETDSDPGTATDLDSSMVVSKGQKRASMSRENKAESTSMPKTKPLKVTEDDITDVKIKIAVKSENVEKDEKKGGDKFMRSSKTEMAEMDVDDMNGQRSKAGKDTVSDRKNGTTRSDKAGSDAGDRENKRIAETPRSEVGLHRNRRRVKTAEPDGGDRNKPTTKSGNMEKSAAKGVGSQKVSSKQKGFLWLDGNQPPSSNSKAGGNLSNEAFPAGWTYRGLAQIAEKDRSHGQGKLQCGRTDGRDWRCPLKVQEGFTLCEHHLNKSRLKKMGKGLKGDGRATARKPDLSAVSPQTSDSTFKPPTPRDYDPDGPPKVRRKYKTVKLSGL